MKNYVLGFAFSEDGENLVLIEKQKPEWQKGKLNGVGGKIEESDYTPIDAMIREFKEETGVNTTIEDWKLFAIIKNDKLDPGIEGSNGYTMYCYRMFNDNILSAKTQEEEKIVILSVDQAMCSLTTRSCRVLIPMAYDREFDFAEITHLR